MKIQLWCIAAVCGFVAAVSEDIVVVAVLAGIGVAAVLLTIGFDE